VRLVGFKTRTVPTLARIANAVSIKTSKDNLTRRARSALLAKLPSNKVETLFVWIAQKERI
jgi:hypothetical protein